MSGFGLAPDHVRALIRVGFTHREVRWLERVAKRARQRASGIDPGPLRSANR